MHRILISAAHKSSGKTTIRIGLAAALSSANPRRPGLRSPLRIAGVTLNRLGGHRETKLRAVIEHYTDAPVISAVQEGA